MVAGELLGDRETEIHSVAILSTATSRDLAFYDGNDRLPATGAGCVVIGKSFARSLMPSELNELAVDLPLIVADDPKYAFAIAADSLIVRESSNGWHDTAVIDDIAGRSTIRARSIGAFATIGRNTSIGEGTSIAEGVRVGNNVTIGRDCFIHPNCVIYDGVEIGDRCVIHSGAVIGADGFGYVKGSDGSYQKFPQIGRVLIGNDVEIGANSCIDRGSLGDTTIGDGTKLDNLVQVAHNVSIGQNVVIAAQTGISGSCVIEDNCVIGGQVGIGDHATIKTGAVIGSQAGVLPGKIVRYGVWWGTPVQPLADVKRQNAHIKHLERLKNEVRELRQKISGGTKNRDQVEE